MWAEGQQVYTNLADFQAEIDALNRWTVLGSCLSEGRKPIILPSPQSPQHDSSAFTTACADATEDALCVEADELNQGAPRRLSAAFAPQGQCGPQA